MGELARGSTPGPGFADFTLAELQLLALGLWVLADEDRVDYTLMADYRGLRARLTVALQQSVAAAVRNG